MDALKERQRVFFILYLGTFIFRFAFGTAALLAITIMKNLGYGPFAIVAFAISFSLPEGLLAGATGYATDILDARIVLLSSAVIASISMLIYLAAYPFATNLQIFLMILIIGHIVHGISSSLKVTPTVAVITRYTEYRDRARMMGFYDMILMYGRICGLAVSGVLYSIFVNGSNNGFEAAEALKAFLILAVIFIFTGFLFYMGLPHIPPERKGRVEHLWTRIFEHIGAGAKVMFGKLRRDQGITWFTLACLWGLLFTLGPYTLMRDLGVDEEKTGFITAIIVLFIGGTSPFWGYVADKIGRKKTATIGVLGLLITAMLGVLSYKVFNITYEDIEFYIILAPGIFCFASIGPSFLGRLGDTAVTGERGIVSSGFQFVTSMGEVTGVIIGGIGYYWGHKYFMGKAWEKWGGLIGIGIPALIFFFLTIIFGLRLKHDEVLLMEIRELEAKKHTYEA